jgi:trans-2,3-dihydro-3-hydroxyanthranilate isomerase
MRRRFATLDVFTETRYVGNPLAVVLDSDGLDTAAMQVITNEFKHSETVFVAPPVDRAYRAAVRIFTPGGEIPFAGHPTVGTAVMLARLDGGTQPRKVVLEEKIGPVACDVTPVNADLGRATFAIPKLPAQGRALADVAAVAAALSLAPAYIGFDNLTPSRWSAGNPMIFVPIRSLDALGRANPDLTKFEKAFTDPVDGPGKVYLYCRETSDRAHDFRARMFAPRWLTPHEDPATGSAVAAFSGLLAATGRYGDGAHRVCVAQGFEMGRASLIELTLTMAGGKLTAATIGGGAVVVTEGMIEA